MAGMKTGFERLVISHKLSQELVALGLHRAAALHWYDNAEDDITAEPGEEKWCCGNLMNPGEGSIPAWTMEECRIMIGNWHTAPDLPEPRPKPNDGEDTTFFLYTLQKGYQFKSGAEAAGTMLKMLLEAGMLKPEEVNKRYFSKFKPE